MFSQASVCSKVDGTSNASWDRSHGRVPLPSDIRPGDLPMLVTSGGEYWRPIQSFSFGNLPPESDIWWWQLKPKHGWFPSGQFGT